MSDALADAVTEYQQACEALAVKQREERLAGAAETSARNRVNTAQKKIDSILAELQKGAPRDSDWQRAEHDRGQARIARTARMLAQ